MNTTHESPLETKIKMAAESAVLRVISEGAWIAPDYSNRWKLPPEFLAEVWALVDSDKLKKAMASRIEQELADRIVNHMAAEMATDVKQILSVKERREALREVARQHVIHVMKQGTN